jgi:hypothetical protein
MSAEQVQSLIIGSGIAGKIMIIHDNQRFMAQRMEARIRSHTVDHAPLVTAPTVVVDIIREAIADIFVDSKPD